MDPTVYYGEHKCQNNISKQCPNKAYYRNKGELLCGVHCKNKLTRKDLPKRSKESKLLHQQETQLKESELIEKAQLANKKNGKKGQVVLSRLQMIKNPENMPGFLKVFPNYKHQNRKDGFGCMRLSPKSLGPVEHGQPGLPPAKNLENFHQGSKCFQIEADEKGNPTKKYHESRKKFYEDPEPHRHKYPNSEKTLCSIWIDKSGKEHKLNYAESRQFYCNFYERLVSKEKDFAKLQKMVDEESTNIQICGYDAFSMSKSIEEEYLDKRHPFGHERVLYTMLVEEPSNWPWRRHKTFDF